MTVLEKSYCCDEAIHTHNSSMLLTSHKGPLIPAQGQERSNKGNRSRQSRGGDGPPCVAAASLPSASLRPSAATKPFPRPPQLPAAPPARPRHPRHPGNSCSQLPPSPEARRGQQVRGVGAGQLGAVTCPPRQV